MGVQTKIKPDTTELDVELDRLLSLKRLRTEGFKRKLIMRERNACIGRGTFKTFVQMVWKAVLKPGKPMEWNWHLDAICEMMEAIHFREITRLIVNVPPRSSKSTLISHCYPIWVWLQDPTHQFLCVAHSAKKARADAVKSRNIIRSPWFKERFGDLFQMAADVNAKERYNTTAGGHRLSYGVTTMLAGEDADTVLIDDPMDPDTVKGDSDRAHILDNYDDSISQRLNDPIKSAIIIVMQRLHQQDLTGHVLANSEKGEWVHLMFAQEYDPEHPFMTDLCRKLDPRRKPGELLWPVRFPESYLKKRRRTMTALGYSGQHQQRPTPAAGAILKKKWWIPWKETMPDMEFVLHSWDTAFSEEGLKKNARSALVSFGVFWHERKNRWAIMLLRGYARHLDYPDLRTFAKKVTRKDKPDQVIIEKKASGHSLIQDLHRAGIPAIKYNPDRDKIARMYAAAPFLEAGMVYYPDGKRWCDEVLEECASAPYGQYKDFADAVSQALIRLAKMDFFQHPDDEDTDLNEEELMRREQFDDEDEDARGGGDSDRGAYG